MKPLLLQVPEGADRVDWVSRYNDKFQLVRSGGKKCPSH